MGEVLAIHHGSASGTLSNLHRVGRIVRLRQVRQRCKVYVLPEFVNERETEPYGKAPDFVQQRLEVDLLAYLGQRAQYGDSRAENLLARMTTGHGQREE
jgi:hypothetical protein